MRAMLGVYVAGLLSKSASEMATIGALSGSRYRKTGTERGRPPLLTDAQILEMRALDQFAGWSRKRLAERFGCDLEMVGRVLSGVTRSRLVATRAHLPEADHVA